MIMTAFWFQIIFCILISLMMAGRYNNFVLICIPASIVMSIANCVVIVCVKATFHVFPFIGIIFYLLVLMHHIWLVKHVQEFKPMQMICSIMLIAYMIFTIL